jgi:ABC-type Fe3+-siderophore transport system permease subunit
VAPVNTLDDTEDIPTLVQICLLTVGLVLLSVARFLVRLLFTMIEVAIWILVAIAVVRLIVWLAEGMPSS